MFETIGAHLPAGLNALSFDFHCNGDSGGDKANWSFGDYEVDVNDDLRGIVLALRERGQEVVCLCGHSRGANVVLMYGYTYDDVPYLVSLSARFDATKGIEKWVPQPGDVQRLINGEIDEVACPVVAPDGHPRVIRAKDVRDKMAVDMTKLKAVKKAKRVFLVHGKADEIIDWEEAEVLRRQLSVQTDLYYLEGADHCLRSPVGKKPHDALYKLLNDHVFKNML